MTGLRGPLWRLLAVLCWLLLPIALTSGWLATVVTDADAYVDTVGPLASDPTVQREVAQRLEPVVVDTVEDSTGLTVSGRNRELVSDSIERAVASERFETVWRAANREAHRQAIRILDGDEGTVTDGGRVVIELGPIFTQVIESLDQRGLVDAASVPRVAATIPVANVEDLDRAQTLYQLLDAAGFWLPVLWLVLVAATLLVAPQRRRAANWLAAGSMVGLVLLAVALLVVRSVVVRQVGSSDDDDLVRAMWDVLVSSLYWSIGVGLVIALVVLVVMAVLGRRRRV